MACLRPRSGYIQLYYYDRILKKRIYRSTHLNDTPENWKIAEQKKAEFENQLNKKYNELQSINRNSIRGAFNHFLENYRDRNPRTIASYKYFHRYFLKVFKEDDLCFVINKVSFENWILWLKTLPLSKNSIHGIAKRGYQFLNFCFEYEYCKPFIVNKGVKTRPEIKEKIIFEIEDIQNIFHKLDLYHSNLNTVLYLLYYTGLRPTDLMTLECKNIDLERRIMKYYSPKSDKYREIPFHPDLVNILKIRIDKVKEGKLLNFSDDHAIGRAFRRHLVRINLADKGYSSRTFRKTFASLLANCDVPDSIAKELMGHSQQDVLNRHYKFIFFKKLKEGIVKLPSIDDLDEFNERIEKNW